MFINLYQPAADDNKPLITFISPSSINAITSFIYSYVASTGAVTSSSHTTTKLVSGYEKKMYRKVSFSLSIVNNSNDDSANDGYVISCVRLPYISMGLLKNVRFELPLGVIVVQLETMGVPQVWHVFGVRKRREPPTFKKIIGVTVNENGHDVFYAKELINLRGNVPSAFLSFVAKHTNTMQQDIEIINFAYAHVRVNHNCARIITKS
ncbi:ep23 [Sucra jujuba nucleopolyhedrovirus]|uniref:Ep23 n=1 Tax=Sucra jujuba nucleopolyhedrovirus TaxID=1563660 RepID=A0A097P8V7_9ABAC|nr:ep23 [Sucra jujuba nucleopolyhedrovirus]AIU41261.1 ep23 [Sucra jujuba nucleopolyhedrovirus]